MEKKVVQKAYDKIAEKYHSERVDYSNDAQIKRFVELIPKGSKVLDVGCGAGVPVSRALVDADFNVTGIDLSENMLKLYKKNVPEANARKMSMTDITFDSNSFDGLTAFYTIFHTPKEKHLSIFKDFHKILKEDGVMIFNVGSKEDEGTQDFFGETMYWSNYDPEKTMELVREAGFDILYHEVITIGDETHFWIIAKNLK